MSEPVKFARIVVVEDDVDLRRLVVTHLKSGGYEVFEAGTGRAGLDAISKHKPDLVVLDLGLPDKPGHQVCKEIRRDDSRLPVLVLTARMDKTAHEEVMACGASDFLVKPARREKLLPMIADLLEDAEKAKAAKPKRFGLF